VAATPAPSPSRNLFRQLLRDSGYVLSGLPLAIVGFVVAVTGFSLSLGLLVTALGLPVLAGTLYAVRVLADVERIRLPAVLGVPRIRPVYRVPDSGASFWRRTLTPARDLQSWLDLLHAFCKMPVATVTFSVLLTWWALAVAGVSYGAYDRAIPYGPNDQSLSALLGMGNGSGARIFLNTAIGVFALLTLPLVARACARIEGSLSRSLLTGVAEMRNRITILEEQKRAAASAEANALRKLDPALEEASMSLSATPLQVLRTVTLPMLRPGLITAFLFCFIVSFDEATVTIFLIAPDVNTLPVRILTQIQESASPVIAAIATFLILFTLSLVLLLERTVGLELFAAPQRER